MRRPQTNRLSHHRRYHYAPVSQGSRRTISCLPIRVEELRTSVEPVKSNNAEIRVAVAGAGAAGSALIEALDAGVPGCVLTAISARDIEAARQRFAHLRSNVAFVGVDDLEPIADLVVEC